MTELARARALLAEMREQMPLLDFMALEVVAFDGRQLTLRAPLDPNRNDKGTAFAGAIASLSTVTGWALLTLWARARHGHCQVAVYHTEISYRHPIAADFEATAVLPAEAELQKLSERLQTRGKGRVDVHITVASTGLQTVIQNAGYALWRAADAG